MSKDLNNFAFITTKLYQLVNVRLLTLIAIM